MAAPCGPTERPKVVRNRGFGICLGSNFAETSWLSYARAPLELVLGLGLLDVQACSSASSLGGTSEEIQESGSNGDKKEDDQRQGEWGRSAVDSPTWAGWTSLFTSLRHWADWVSTSKRTADERPFGNDCSGRVCVTSSGRAPWILTMYIWELVIAYVYTCR